MTITQTVEIPVDRRLIIEVPREIPAGKVILTFTPVKFSIQRKDPRTIAEALEMAKEQAADPNRKPISRLFGKHKGIFGENGTAYQKAIRNEWD